MDDVCWDNGKHDTDEEAGRGKTQRRAGGGAHIRAHGQGKRTGPDRARRGLLKQFTKSVLETALDEEMTEHLGRAKHKKSKDGRAANTRNGTTAKTVVTDSVGPVRIEVPRDRDGSFEPVVVRKRQRRLPGVGEVVLSLYARGLTTGEISAHFQEIYGADVSRETVSRITERVVAEKDEWCSRPLDRVYAAVFIDATVVKVRDGQVANRAFYVAVGVDLEGGRDVLGIWASPAAEGAVWPLAIVQTCVVHLLRNTFRHASKKDWDAIKRDVKPIYTAPSAAAAAAARDAMLDKWEARYPAIRRLWMDAWERFIPFLDYDVEIRRVICTTNAIESLNARFKRSIRARGHFPDEQAALKCMYLTVRSLDPTGKGRIRWSARWKPALNAFAITFADRWPSEGTQQ